MSTNIIDFNKSKQRLINKKYPNISPIMPSRMGITFTKTNKALDKFKKVFYEYQESLFDDGKSKKVAIEEVFIYYNFSKVPKYKEAIDYAVLSSGKRLRPFLMLAAYNFCGGGDFLVLTPFMVAIELIHTYSLVHDDLPCMDNDELRRGKPTVWKAYGEDMAVLVGDGLLSEAATILIEIILEFSYTEYSSYVITSALLLLKLAGLDGMVVGQVFDVLNTNNKKLTMQDISYMYAKKTTALLTASLVTGFNMSARYKNGIDLIELLSTYIGESYQIKDDLLEKESTTSKIGKSTNSDKNNNKVTYVELVGVENAKKRLQILYEATLNTIDLMADNKDTKEKKVFQEIIKYVLNRDR